MKRFLTAFLLLMLAGCAAGQAGYAGRCAEYARLCQAGYEEYCLLYMNCNGDGSDVLVLSEDGSAASFVKDYMYSRVNGLRVESMPVSDAVLSDLWQYDLIVVVKDDSVLLVVRDNAPVHVISLAQMLRLDLQASLGIEPSQKLLSTVTLQDL